MLKTVIRLGGLWLFVAALTPLWARDTPDFRSQADLPALGLRLRLPANAAEQPLAPLQRLTYQFRQGEREWTEDRYEARDIWYRTQHVGQWLDARGNLMVLAQVTRGLPAGFDAPHVTRAQFDVLAAEQPDLSMADTDALMLWARDFLGVEPGPPEVLRFQPVRIRAAMFVPTPNEQRMLYLFRVNVRRGGERTAQPRTFAAELRLVAGADPARARTVFEDRFLRTLDVLTPSGPQGLSGGRGESDPALAGDDEAMRRSREDAQKSIAHLSGWWHHDTAHYIMLSNQQRGSSFLIRDLERDLETMRAAYSALVPPLRAIRRVSIIRLFETPEAYLQYVGPAHAWSGGIWDDARGELVIRPMPGGGRSREARERVLRTIFHEAFHQYLSHATAPLRPCVWFNEGHAAFFENVELRGDRITFEENTPFVERIGEMPLRALFDLDYPAFYAEDASARQRHYATAWALIYYLQRAGAAESRFAYASLIGDYLEALEREGSGRRATQAILSRHDLDGLERDFLNFWNSPRRRSFAQRAPALP